MIHRESVTIENAVKPSAILQTLRNDYRNGIIGKTDFLLNAGELYLDNHLLLRAMALIQMVDIEVLLPEQSFHYIRLKQKIVSLPSTQNSICTLNMIVKNEELTIADALDSVDTIMDEIVICDTGSTDNTIHLAEQYGVTIVHDLWQDDFSRARNTAIEASTGDWIFWMDADDRLEEKSAEPLRQLWRSGKPQGAAFCIVNEREYAAPVEFIQVRLFPRNERIRFEQRVHEQIMFSIARQKIPFSRHPEIRIRHNGYRTNEIHIKKAKRNKPLLLAEIGKNPHDPTLQLSLADCLNILGENDKAKYYYSRITMNEKNWLVNSDVFVQAHINLAKSYTRDGDTYNAKRYFLRSLYLDNTRIEACYALGRIFLDEGNEIKAMFYLMKSARITPPLRLTAVDNLIIRLESIYYLVELLIARLRYEEAERILLPAIKAYPMVPQYYNQLGRIYRLQNKIARSALYFTMSAEISPERNDPAYEGMAEIYNLLGDPETAAQFLQKKGNKDTRSINMQYSP